MVRSYKRFEQFQEVPSIKYWNFPLKQGAALTTSSVPNFLFQPRRVANQMLEKASSYAQPQSWVTAHQLQRFPMLPKVKKNIAYSRGVKLKETFWEEFKRIYVTEVIAFTMSKSTLFTLIFSFMFLGCIFFLGGFFTATSIYHERHLVHEVSRQHMPTEVATLQGRPEKIVDMGTGMVYAAPQAYQSQGGVRLDRNGRRPSAYVERQLSTRYSNYR